ncbi:DNA polymerase I [Caldinitratiruptor microaerophilus]|uniref:DNA polymerase I n=1 Tax=Caldinitratiruptor microaerophilus TaxID=671077 RepID=A0AA35CMD3_9FIRM|nr:DNA polymerase I [Caldinitratiruptor microaerophilus]
MPGAGKLVLIDGNSLAYRAYFSFQEFRASGGFPTGAIFGFLRMLYKVLDDEQPTHLAVAFDVPGPTFRDEWYAAYKATRQAAPDDFKVQLGPLREVLRALRVPYLELAGYEADDLIGTLSRIASERGIPTVIVTGDRDALQLVDDHVTVLLTRRGVTDVARMDRAAVRAAYGITPEQVVDLKSLMGDPSDNIPGVPGVGEKTAVRLLQAFGTLEGILANIDRVPGRKLQERLREHEADARLSRRLATIDRQVPIEVDLDALGRQEPDYAEAQRLFKQLEFRSLLPRVTPPVDVPESSAAEGGAGPPDAALAAAGSEAAPAGPALQIELVADAAPAARLADALPGTAGLIAPVQPVPAGGPVGPYGRGEPQGVALAPLDGGAATAVWFEPAALPGLDAYWSRATDLAAFDVKPFYVWLLRRGVAAAPPAFDGAVAAYLLDPGRSTYRVDDLLRQYGLGEVPDPASPGGRAAAAARLGRLREAMRRDLEEAGLWPLFAEVEMPLLPILARMEATGIRVDREQLEAIGRELDDRIVALQQEIWTAAGMQFNINSTKQLGEVLFEKLGLPTVKRTKTGYSTDAEVLEELAALHDVPAKILDYRTLVKLKGTYVDGLKELVEPDGRVHTTFNQTVAATGRLSSADPNLQNIPIREEEGRRLRKVFVPAEGWVLFAADYSQIELRIAAHFSGDPALREAFEQGQDVHARTAAEVFGLEIDQVTKEQRRMAKTVNFGLLYGQSDFGLARALRIGRGEARAFIERYFERYPGVKRYMEEKVREAREKGYVTTLLGRRRFLPDIHSRTFAVRQNAERAAINTPIQGTAADLMKLAMIAVDREVRRAGLRARMLLQVHDELVFEAPPEEIPRLREIAEREMTGAMRLSVPLAVETRVGPNWYDMVPADEWLAARS